MPSLKSTADATGYILCTSPRSGSTLLCAMLKAAGAGQPESLFYATEVAGWAKRFGLNGPGGDPAFLRQLFAAGAQEGRGDTSVFGLRQQRRSFPALCEALTLAYPEAQSDPDRLTAAFGPHVLIYLTRQDKLAQAVSMLRAEATGLWHLGADGREVERNALRRSDHFDAQAIADTVRLMRTYDADWQRWFEEHRLRPLTVTYEDLAAGPEDALKQVLGFIGVPEARAKGMGAPLAKLADGVTQEWIARFEASPEAQTL